MNAYAKGIRDTLAAIGYGLDERELTELEGFDGETRLGEGTPNLDKIIRDMETHWTWGEHAALIIDGETVEEMFASEEDQKRYGSLTSEDFEQLAVSVTRDYEITDETYQDISDQMHYGADKLLRKRELGEFTREMEHYCALGDEIMRALGER